MSCLFFWKMKITHRLNTKTSPRTFIPTPPFYLAVENFYSLKIVSGRAHLKISIFWWLWQKLPKLFHIWQFLLLTRPFLASLFVNKSKRLIFLMDLVIFRCDQIWTRKGAGTTSMAGAQKVVTHLVGYSIFQHHDLEVLRQDFTRDFRHERASAKFDPLRPPPVRIFWRFKGKN